MSFTTYTNYHLVKSEDLNHHGTLYAGRTAEWFVESGFIAAASATNPENVVCLKIHGMTFTRPVRRGEVVCFQSQIVLAGRSRLVARVSVAVQEQTVVEGYITFIHVDENGKTLPHGVTVTPETPEELRLNEEANQLR